MGLQEDFGEKTDGNFRVPRLLCCTLYGSQISVRPQKYERTEFEIFQDNCAPTRHVSFAANRNLLSKKWEITRAYSKLCFVPPLWIIYCSPQYLYVYGIFSLFSFLLTFLSYLCDNSTHFCELSQALHSE